MGNVKAVTGKFAQVFNEEMNPNGLDLYELAEMIGIPFKLLYTDQLQHVHRNEKNDLIGILTSYEIDEIYMNKIQGLKFRQSDIIRMKDTNIVEISSDVLDYDYNCILNHIQPWVEFGEIKTLRKIHLKSLTIISLWQLKQLPFYAIKIRNSKVFVTDIRIVRDLLESLSLSTFYRPGPSWILRIYVKLSIYLRSN